jgi:hypothetical protein
MARLKTFRPLTADDFDDVAGEDDCRLVPEGHYPSRLERWEPKLDGRWGEKAIFFWRVFLSADFSEERSVIIPRYYNVARDERGKPVFGHHHDFRKDWVGANGGRRPLQWSRLPPAIFEKSLYVIRVITVRRDSKSNLPAGLHYSRVDRIIRPVRDEEIFGALPF